MSNNHAPEGYNTISSYMIVPGAARFISFLQEVFDGTEIMRHMHDENIIQHAEVRIGNSAVMFADTTDQWPASTCSMFIYVASADDTYQKALAAGAASIMPPTNQNYGRSCGIKDPFGNTWWITSVQ